MTYVVEVTNGTETRVCEVISMYDIFGEPTTDPDKAVSGVIRLATHQFIDFDASATGMFTVH